MVTPCASQSLKTYSAVVPCSMPPMCPCMSTKPGRTYIFDAVDLASCASVGRRFGSIGTFGKPTLAHFLDAVAFDDDVHRPDRRRAGAVDDRRAADDQPLERPFAFIGTPVGRVRLARFLGFLGESGEGEKEKEERDDFLHRAAL